MSHTRILRYAVFLAAWAASLFGAAQVYRIDMGYLAFLCGRWGCLAPTSSLLGVHLLGMLTLAGASFGITSLRPSLIPKVRKLLLWFGSVAIVAIISKGFYTWHPESISEIVRLIPYSIANETDVPAVQSILVSLTLGWIQKATVAVNPSEFPLREE